MESKCYLGPSNKRRLDSDEAKVLIEKIDVAWMLEHFGSDKMAAREYARQEAGDKMLVARDFVAKAYCTMGRGFDLSLPRICSEKFWNKIEGVTMNLELRNSSFLRYLELNIPDSEDIKLVTDGEISSVEASILERTNYGMMWEQKSDKDNSPWFNCCNRGEEQVLVDGLVELKTIASLGSITKEIVFVITAEYFYIVGHAIEKSGLTWHFHHKERVERIRSIAMNDYSGFLRFVAMRDYGFESIRVFLKSYLTLKTRIALSIGEALQLEPEFELDSDETIDRYSGLCFYRMGLCKDSSCNVEYSLITNDVTISNDDYILLKDFLEVDHIPVEKVTISKEEMVRLCTLFHENSRYYDCKLQHGMGSWNADKKARNHLFSLCNMLDQAAIRKNI